METIKLRSKRNYWLLPILILVITPAYADRGTGHEVEPIVFLHPELSGEYIETNAVREKCAVDSSLQNAIREQAISLGAKIEFAEDESAFTSAKRQLYVTILNVEANWWRPMTYRPYSLMTLVVRVDVDGRTVKSVKKNLNTGIAFTACERLNHIAASAGKFVVEWATKVQARL